MPGPGASDGREFIELRAAAERVDGDADDGRRRIRKPNPEPANAGFNKTAHAVTCSCDGFIHHFVVGDFSAFAPAVIQVSNALSRRGITTIGSRTGSSSSLIQSHAVFPVNPVHAHGTR